MNNWLLPAACAFSLIIVLSFFTIVCTQTLLYRVSFCVCRLSLAHFVLSFFFVSVTVAILFFHNIFVPFCIVVLLFCFSFFVVYLGQEKEYT